MSSRNQTVDMKKSLRFILRDMLIISIYYLFLFLFPSSLSAQSLQLSVQLEKSNYLICEDIYYVMQLTNNSNRSLLINYPYLTTGAFRFWIRDDGGREYKYWGRKDGKGKMSIAAEPFYSENSLFWYAEQDEKNINFQYFGAGSYTAQAVYAPFDNQKDTIVSEILHFTVSAPVGNEISPFNLYRESHRLSWLMKEN